MDWFGWDRNSELMATIADTLAAIAVGLSGKKLTDDLLVPRPKSQSEKKSRPKTVAEFDVAWFLGQLAR